LQEGKESCTYTLHAHSFGGQLVPVFRRNQLNVFLSVLIASSDIKIILQDFNAKVGKEYIYKPTIGNENLHNETNNNGIKMIQFAITKGLNVRSTTFPHKDIHKETQYSADGRTVN